MIDRSHARPIPCGRGQHVVAPGATMFEPTTFDLRDVTVREPPRVRFGGRERKKTGYTKQDSARSCLAKADWHGLEKCFNRRQRHNPRNRAHWVPVHCVAETVEEFLPQDFTWWLHRQATFEPGGTGGKANVTELMKDLTYRCRAGG